ncbi:MAG: serine hydrolase [Bacteroidetes bacterium]|nr:serine hydrolase [Bacteroidota bacterium]
MTKTNHVLVALILFLSLLLPSISFSYDDPWKVHFPKTTTKIPGIKDFMRKHDIYGILVIKNNKRVVEEYNDLNTMDDLSVYKRTGNHEDRQYGIASITKSITATVLGSILEKSENDLLSQTIGEVFTDYANTSISCRTVKDLLLMQGGTKWRDTKPWWWLFWGESDATKMRDDVQNNGSTYQTYIKEFTKDKQCKDDTKFEYQAIDSSALGLFVDSFSSSINEGENPVYMPEVFADNIWNKLKFEGTIKWKGEVTWKGYSNENKELIWKSKSKRKGAAAAYCCMYLSPRDLTRFGNYVLYNYLAEEKTNKAPLADWVKQSVTTVARDRDREKEACIGENPIYKRYGYQWWMLGDETNVLKYGFTAIGKGGQFLRVIPEHNTVIVQLSNRDQKLSGIECASYRYQNEILKMIEN